MTEEKIVNIVNENNIKSMQDTVKLLMREWTKRNLAVEIASLEGNRIVIDPVERRIKDYATSTKNRHMFLLYNIRAFYDNESISYKELIKLLNISRNGLDTMINECVSSEWVIFTEGKTKNDGKFKAANIVVEAYEDYADWLWREWENAGPLMQSQSIIEIRNMLAHAK